MAKHRLTISHITAFITWVIPWVIGIPIAEKVGFLFDVQPVTLDTGTAIFAVLQFLVFLAVFLILIRVFGSKVLSLGVFVTIAVGIIMFFDSVLGQKPIPSFVFTLVILYISERTRALLVRNAVIILGLLGIGLYVGPSFAPSVFLGFLVLLSVYDLVAVLSGYLPRLVKGIQKKGEGPIFVLIQIPEKLSHWIRYKKTTRVRAIGTGDLFAPLLLFVSFASAGQLLEAWITALGASVGVIADLYIIQHYKPERGIPALPTITIGIFVAYAMVKYMV